MQTIQSVISRMQVILPPLPLFWRKLCKYIFLSILYKLSLMKEFWGGNCRFLPITVSFMYFNETLRKKQLSDPLHVLHYCAMVVEECHFINFAKKCYVLSNANAMSVQ